MYDTKPNQFCKEILGAQLWSKQIEVLKATIAHKHVAVRSGHGVGKTFAVACLVLWWLFARRGRVITTAPTWESVEGVLWKEINARFSQALVSLPGRINQTDLLIDNAGWDASGLNTNKPSAFQGRHHPRLLVVLDEAPGVAEQIHLEVSTLATGEENRIVMIGNPTELSGTFYDAFKSNDWHHIHISCLDHPNIVTGHEYIKGAVTTGWIEGRRKAWGEGHPFWFSRVLGDFPKISNKGVIPLLWIERQTNEDARQVALKDAEGHMLPRIGGLDVARYGDNLSVLTIRQGDAIISQTSWHHATLTETAGRAHNAIKEHNLKTLVVDASGLGAGVADILFEQDDPIVAYNGGHAAFTRNTFTNRRTEMWWHLRERFEKGRIWLPKIEAGSENRVVSDLVSPTYTISATGRIKLETKEELLTRGVRSPDWADSLVLCFAQDEDPAKELEEQPNEQVQDPIPMLESRIEQASMWTQLPDM